MNFKNTILFLTGFFCWISCMHAQNKVQVDKERSMIELRLKEYSKYLLEGDSVSIAAMYAVDASIGCKKGPEIIDAAGNWIRNGIENNSRHVTFKTASLIADGDLLIESGKAEGRSDSGELKYAFRYIVVWKKENSEWKLYRDITL